MISNGCMNISGLVCGYTYIDVFKDDCCQLHIKV